MPDMSQNMPTHFNGEGDAERWIVSLEMTLLQHKNNKDWIRLVNSLLDGKVQLWADNDPGYKAIKALPDPTDADKQRFIELIQTEYPGQERVETTQAGVERLIKALHQEPGEKLEAFYIRAKAILAKAGIKDHLHGSASLSLGDSMILSQVITAFVAGLHSKDLQRKVNAKYSDITDPSARSLKGAYDIAGAQETSMKKKELRKKEDDQKADQAIEHAAFGAMKELMTGGPNRTRALKSLTSSLNVSPESFQAVFLPTTHSRPPRPQGPRIPSQDRFQDVTTESHSQDHHNTRYQPGYSSQDARAQHQALNRSIASTASAAPHGRNGGFYNGQLDTASHPNPFINGSMVYDRMVHGFCCFKCGGLGHMGRECEAGREKWLSKVESKALMDAIGYIPRPRSPPPTSNQPWQPTGTNPYQAAAPPAKESAVAPAGPFNPSVRQATYYTGDLVSPQPLPSMPLLITQGPAHQPYVSDPDNEDSESYEHKESTVGVGKVLGELDGPGEVAGMPVAKSITMKSGDSHDDYNPQVLASKRRKPNEGPADSEEEVIRDDDDVAMTEDRPKKNIVKKKGKKKTMKPISGMIGKPEVNVEAILSHNTITLPAMHLYQISPYFRDETKRLIQAPRKPRRKKEKKGETAEEARVDYASMDSEGDDAHWAVKEYHDTLSKEKMAFGVPATLSKDGTGPIVKLSYEDCKADQGSDLVLMDERIAKRLNLRYRSTREFSPRGVTMTVADGNHTRLNHWVTFEIDVEGIKRTVWAFINPRSTSTKLLLGLPWLRAVDAFIDVKKKTIQIGDTDKDEVLKHVSPYQMASESSLSKGKKLTKKEIDRIGKTIRKVAKESKQVIEEESESEYTESEESDDDSYFESSSDEGF